MIPKSYVIEKLDKFGFIRVKKFCTSKDISSKYKDNPWTGRKYLHIISNKGLVFRIHKKTYSYHVKTSKSIFKKWIVDLSRHFSTAYMQMANKSMKRCSSSLTIRERQLKTQWNTASHRWGWLWSKGNNECCLKPGEIGTWDHSWWGCKRCSLFGKQSALPPVFNVELPCVAAVLLLGVWDPGDVNTNVDVTFL